MGLNGDIKMNGLLTGINGDKKNNGGIDDKKTLASFATFAT